LEKSNSQNVWEPENVFHTCGILIWQPNTAEISEKSVLAKGQIRPALLLHDLLIIDLSSATEAIAPSVAASYQTQKRGPWSAWTVDVRQS